VQSRGSEEGDGAVHAHVLRPSEQGAQRFHRDDRRLRRRSLGGPCRLVADLAAATLPQTDRRSARIHSHQSPTGSASRQVLFLLPVFELVWLGSLTVTCRTCNPEVTQGRRQVVHTHVPLSPSSIIWYRSKGGDAPRLGR